MPSKRQLANENDALKAEVKGMRELLSFSIQTTKIGVLALAERIPPTKEDMNILAEEFPRWSISCQTEEDGFSEGDRKIVKCFVRDMSDLRPNLHKDRDTYLRFADAEHFDWGVREALGLGDQSLGYISGDGSFGRDSNGFCAYINLEIEGESAITKLDLIRIKAAEQYLQSEGLFAEAVVA